MKLDKPLKGSLRASGAWLWHTVSNNIWYKLLAILIAVLFWSYAISSNPTLTTDRTLSNVEIEISGTSVLTSRKLALLTDVTTEAQHCQVKVTAPRASALQVSNDNVHVELDLSSVRSTGRQKVRLKGSSVYGTVQQISPAEIEVEIDTYDSRSVPVIVQQVGEISDELWCDASRKNPMNIVVSGPSQLVRRASQAIVQIDMTSRDKSDSRAEPFFIVDTDGNELPPWLTASTSSVTVNLDIYPKKLLPVSVNIDEILEGELPRGFEIDGIVEVQPQQIQVAADKVLLDSLSSVAIEPIDITGRTGPFTASARIKKLADVKNYSAESVNVSVSIIESTASKVHNNMSVKLTGLPAGLRAKWTNDSPRVVIVVSGLFTTMQNIARADVSAWVDLSEITESGTYELPIQVAVDNFPELSCLPSPETAKVTITKR